MSHSHWPKSWPEFNTRRCSLPKKDCDALWAAYLHDHVGLPCRKLVQPGNKIATCTLRGMAKRLATGVRAADQQAAFESYMKIEARRVAEILEEA